MMTKRRLGLCLGMVRFDPDDVFADETPAAEPLGEPPVVAPRRRARRLAGPSSAPTNPLLQQTFPSWARPPKEPARRRRRGEAAFFAGAGLALLDQILRARSAVRRGAAPAPGLARRDRLRRPGAPSRGFFRAARRRASFAQRRRERAHQPRRPRPSAMARFRRAPGAVRQPKSAQGRRSARTAARPRFRGARRGLRTSCAGEENPLAAAARARASRR